MPGGGVLPIWITAGQGLTVLAVGAGGDCSDILFLSPIISLFFLLLSGMDGWVACGLSPFQQNFMILGHWVGDGRLYAMESRLRLRRSGARIRDR